MKKKQRMVENMLATVNLDGGILLWVQENVRNDILTPIFKFFTMLGDGGMVWIVFAFLILFFMKGYRKGGFMVGLSLLGSLLFNNTILKNIVQRVRPYRVIEELTILVPEPGEFSFPSGHTASSFAAAIVMLMVLPKKYGIPAVILAFLISLSRIYVGVHYPTDVLGGMVMGTLIALLVVKGWNYIEAKIKGKKEAR